MHGTGTSVVTVVLLYPFEIERRSTAMEQSSLFDDGVDIDLEAPASLDAAVPTDARAQAAVRVTQHR